MTRLDTSHKVITTSGQIGLTKRAEEAISELRFGTNFTTMGDSFASISQKLGRNLTYFLDILHMNQGPSESSANTA